jgi:hypothetical protein
MAIYLTMDLPVSRADLEAVSTAMGVRDEIPDGLIAHAAVDRPEGDGIRVVDLWESVEHFQRFADTLLKPTLDRVLAERGVELAGPPPEPTILEAYDVVRGSA